LPCSCNFQGNIFVDTIRGRKEERKEGRKEGREGGFLEE
jgi:hypothetical protein